eukprot:c9157_g1_i6.p1 GENE.c9157_g1_i6~~c9157_g1_i6.p1  ORF type:complete len:146 (+),score=30.97 c9157_g1_i6:207-644(+)
MMPEFYLKKIILDNFPQIPLEPEQADAVDFMVKQVTNQYAMKYFLSHCFVIVFHQLEGLNRQDVASRLVLNTTYMAVDLTKVWPQTLDASVPVFLIDQLAARYPDCKLAQLKTGGDFPYLAAASELNMMLEVAQSHTQKCSSQRS